MKKQSMKGITALIALAAVAALGATGCSSDDRTSKEPATETAAKLDGRAIVGKFQFVYDDVRKHAVEEMLAAKLSDPTELEQAKKDAAEEAAASEIEFTKDGWFLSRIAGKEILRATYSTIVGATSGLDLTMRVGERNDTAHVEVNGDRITIQDPKKGPLTFVRTGS